MGKQLLTRYVHIVGGQWVVAEYKYIYEWDRVHSVYQVSQESDYLANKLSYTSYLESVAT